MSTTEFRDAVIAGLRERGWPEARIHEEDGCAYWARDELIIVWLKPAANRGEWDAGYCLEDETADILIASQSPSRVIEAIDRLRWVFWDWRSGTK